MGAPKAEDAFGEGEVCRYKSIGQTTQTLRVPPSPPVLQLPPYTLLLTHQTLGPQIMRYSLWWSIFGFIGGSSATQASPAHVQELKERWGEDVSWSPPP